MDDHEPPAVTRSAPIVGELRRPFGREILSPAHSIRVRVIGGVVRPAEMRVIAAILIAQFPSTANSLPLRAEQLETLATGEHQAVVNDVRLWYRVAGPPGGTPVVFLHGGPGQGSQSFAQIAGPAFERSHRMVYLDQRGSGRSERLWNFAYSIDLLVEDLEGLRRAWGVEKIALIGHSVGTILAMEYAAKYPEHVDRMVLAAAGPDLLDAFNRMCDRVAASDSATFKRARAALEPGSRRRCNMWGKGVFGPGGMQRFVNGNMFPTPETEKLINESDQARGMRNTGELANTLIKQGLLEYRFARPERLTMPVLVIAGRRDFQAAIEPQRALVAHLSNGRVSEWNCAGHFMWAENPERFAREANAFLVR